MIAIAFQEVRENVIDAQSRSWLRLLGAVLNAQNATDTTPDESSGEAQMAAILQQFGGTNDKGKG